MVLQTIARIVLIFVFYIIISLGNDLRKSRDGTRNGADLQKIKVITSIDNTCDATLDLRQRSTVTSWQHFLSFGRKLLSTLSTLKILTAHLQIFHGTLVCCGTKFGKHWFRSMVYSSNYPMPNNNNQFITTFKLLIMS